MNFGSVLFSFSGRINRAKYWLTVLLWTVVSIVVFGVVATMLAKDIVALGADPSGAEILRVVFGYGIGLVLVFLLVLVPMMISSFAIGVKRLHDRDQSGWWILLFYFGPGVASAIAGSSASGGVCWSCRWSPSPFRSGRSSCSGFCAEREDPIDTGPIRWKAIPWQLSPRLRLKSPLQNPSIKSALAGRGI